MIAIDRKELKTIVDLATLASNWEQWGIEYELFKNGNREDGQDFSWRSGIYFALRKELAELTENHCSFCDSYPFDMTKETIEHYRPKNEFPRQAYQWRNLFYCCDRCQSKSNKKYESNIKPDHKGYEFDRFFYVDLGTFKIEVHDDLKSNEIILAQNFIERYGINDPRRIARRKNVYFDLKNYFRVEYGETHQRERNDFPYRYMYDYLLTQRKE